MTALRETGRAAKAKLETNVSEQLLENQKSLLLVRTPLSEDGTVSIYFSSQDGRPMNLSEWSHLKQLIELVSKMCITQEEKVREAAA